MNSAPKNPKQVFLDAVEQYAPEQWAKYLDRVCDDDTNLRHRVEILLKAHAADESLLDNPAIASYETIDHLIDEKPGSQIGSYKLLEQIGEGGMGVVFMAEQTQPIQRKVALKIIKPGMDTKQVIARFEAERQALALMDHPNIARVLDAGATETGRPYFVMELVRGVPITDYSDNHRLSIRERLELFITICQAVQHAHQKGIIHRDLKPTNVLVTLHDGKPVVKVIDFGVAKATGQKLTEKTLFTGFAQMVGTPLYMSPEQAEPSGLDVDTRSDIYSLGVLLYELLTGQTPFESQRLKEAAFDEMRRIIREEDPPRPGTRLSTLAQQDISTVSEKRASDPRQLSRLFQGELDWIVMKSLDKDRNRRYETASALAADVEHYLHDEPVQACPPSAVYRFRKFARRNKTGLAMATVIALAVVLVAGVGGMMLRDRATRQVVLEQQITQTLDEVKTWHDSGKLTEAISAVKRAEALLASGGSSDEIKRRVDQWRDDLQTVQRLEKIRMDQASHSKNAGPVGESSAETWNPAAADQQYRQEFRRFDVNLESHDFEKQADRIKNSPIKMDLVAALDDWYQVTNWPNKSDPRNEMPRAGRKEILQIARLVDSDPFRDRLRDAIQRGDTDLLARLAKEKDVVVQPIPTVLLLVRTLCLQAASGFSAEGTKILQEVQHQHPADFWINFELADCINSSGTLADEVAFRRVAVALRPDSLGALNALAHQLVAQGNMAEAEQIYREAIRLSPDSPFFFGQLYFALTNQGKWGEAEATCREAIRLKPDYADLYCRLGVALSRQDKLVEAEAAHRESVRLNPEVPLYRSNLCDILKREGKSEEAETVAHELIRLHPEVAESHESLGFFLLEQGKYREAESAYREMVRLKPDSIVAHNSLAATLMRQGNFAAAEPEAREAFRLKPDDTTIQLNLSHALMQQGKYAAAEEFWRDVVRPMPNHPRAHREFAVAMLKRAEAAGDTPPWDEAAAEFVKAIHLVEDKRYRRDHILECAVLVRWEEVFQRVAQLRPNDTALWIGHGQNRALRSRWAEAAVDYAKANRDQPLTDSHETTEYAYLLVLLGDANAHKEFCRELKIRVGEPLDADAAFKLVRACAATPCDADEASQLVRWATQAAATNTEAWFPHVLGLAQYRAGQFAAAIQSLEKSNSIEWNVPQNEIPKTLNWLLLAMAHYRQGDIDEARNSLQTARELIELARPKKPDEPVNLYACDWIPMQVLLREAEALLKEPAEGPKTNTADNE